METHPPHSSSPPPNPSSPAPAVPPIQTEKAVHPPGPKPVHGKGPARPAASKPIGDAGATISLDWSREDIENRLGLFRGGHFTNVNKSFSALVGLVLTVLFIGGLFLVRHLTTPAAWPLPDTPSSAPTAATGTASSAGFNVCDTVIRPNNRWTTYPATFFFFWSMVVLFIKSRKIRFQEMTLDLAAVPQHAAFILNEASAKIVLDRLRGLVDSPQHFILLNRIDRALSNLNNIGGLSDVSTILKAQAENDENLIASSYTLINGLVWAIPVLGFLGTVQGLSLAIGSFTTALAHTQGQQNIANELQKVTSGLSTAFETTLVALVFALVIQLTSNFMQQKETSFLDHCNDYCHAHVISKLRLVRTEPNAPALLRPSTPGPRL